MTAFINALIEMVLTALAVNLSRTTSSVAEGFDLSLYEGSVAVILDAGAATAGTNPTLDVKVTECATSDGTYTDVTSAAFTQVTTTAGVQKLVLDKNRIKRYLGVAWTIGGTVSPAFPFGVAVAGIKKY